MKKLLYLFLVIPLVLLGQDNHVLIFDGINREYLVYTPESYDSSLDYPVLFNFHGGSGYANDFIYTNDMRPIADTAGFIAVYPQGAIDPDGGTTSWIHKAPTDHDDIYFVEAIIDALSLDYSIDQNRIYACGYSEGAILSYELGCRLNDKIAAFAAVSGSMLEDYYRNDIYGWGPCSPVHPTGMMLIPGTVDQNPHSTYEGLSYGDMPLYMSANDITNYWSNYNNTDINPVVTDVVNSAPNDGSTVERKLWLNGDNCVSVQELKVVNGDHDWPGSFGNMDINASEEIWNFVSQFNLEGQIDCNYIIEGCTDETALNYNPEANQDDGSCYFENNSDLCVANLIEGCMSIAVWDPVCGCDYVTYSNSGDAACNSIYDFTSGECTNISDNPCSSISILVSQGWNMIGFACSENINALNAFAAIQDKIIIAKDGAGNAYLPDWDFNGIGDLERGYGYLIKVSEEISNYNICE
jgi:polyhydroxybutyrate depolymerase